MRHWRRWRERRKARERRAERWRRSWTDTMLLPDGASAWIAAWTAATDELAAEPS